MDRPMQHESALHYILTHLSVSQWLVLIALLSLIGLALWSMIFGRSSVSEAGPPRARHGTPVTILGGDLAPGPWLFADGVLERAAGGREPELVLLKYQLREVEQISSAQAWKKAHPLARGAFGYVLAGPLGAAVGLFTARSRPGVESATFRATLWDGRGFVGSGPHQLLGELSAISIQASRFRAGQAKQAAAEARDQ